MPTGNLSITPEELERQLRASKGGPMPDPKPLSEQVREAYNELDCDDYPVLTWIEKIAALESRLEEQGKQLAAIMRERDHLELDVLDTTQARDFDVWRKAAGGT